MIGIFLALALVGGETVTNPELNSHFTHTPEITCLETKVSVASGQAVSRGNLDRVVCDGDRDRPAVHFDPSTGRFIALRDLPARTYIGALTPSVGAGFQPDQALIYEVELGPIRVERQVWAMQAQTAGPDIFVRDPQGNVFSAPVNNLKPVAEVRP